MTNRAGWTCVGGLPDAAPEAGPAASPALADQLVELVIKGAKTDV
jgi:hypothetical protein